MVKIKLRLKRSVQRYLYSRNMDVRDNLVRAFNLFLFIATSATEATTTTTSTATTTSSLKGSLVSGHVAFLILDDGKQSHCHWIYIYNEKQKNA